MLTHRLFHISEYMNTEAQNDHTVVKFESNFFTGTQDQVLELIDSIIKVQGAIREIGRSGRNEYKGYSYSTIDDVLTHLRPITASNGLAIIQVPEEFGCVTTVVAHESGGTFESKSVFGDKQKQYSIQDVGAIITYLKRYSLCAIFAISSGDIDDDAASTTKQHGAAKDNKDLVLKSRLRITNLKPGDDYNALFQRIKNNPDFTQQQKNDLISLLKKEWTKFQVIQHNKQENKKRAISKPEEVQTKVDALKSDIEADGGMAGGDIAF